MLLRPVTPPPSRPTLLTLPPMPTAPNRPTLSLLGRLMRKSLMLLPLPSRLPVNWPAKRPTGMKLLSCQTSVVPAVVAAEKLRSSVKVPVRFIAISCNWWAPLTLVEYSDASMG